MPAPSSDPAQSTGASSPLEANLGASTGQLGSEESTHAFRVDVQVWVGSECLQVFCVPPGEYLVGSDPSCHLQIQAEHVERMHARLSFFGHRLAIEDLESEGGVFIGGMRVSLPTPIQPSTEVHLGAARLVFAFSADALSQIEAELNDPMLGLESIRSEISQEAHRVVGTLGEGGMGMVLKARDQRIHRSVAMKVLRAGNEFSADKLQRFVGEAQLTGQLEHPNIVPVYQLGVASDGQVFYTMKYVRGQTLDQVLQQLRRGNPETARQYPLPTLLTVFQKVADAMAFAHSRGIIHRDLKPANIMIGAFGEVLVMDWGLAKRLTETTQSSEAPASTDSTLELPKDGKFNTMEGSVVGTPPFLSPEQADGRTPLDHRSDIFVLGVILYEILALRPPVELKSSEQVIEALRKGSLIPLKQRVAMPEQDGGPPPKLIHCSRGKLPEGISAVVGKAMRHDRASRYQSVEELQTDLTACQNGFPAAAEEAGWFRQLQLLLGRRRRESLLVVCFLVFSQVLLAYFLGRIASDRTKLRDSEAALSESIKDLRNTNQRLEQIVFQLRNTAESNYKDAVQQLRQRQPTRALAQINLALVGVAESPLTQAKYLIIRGHANTQLGFYTEALEDYRQAARNFPGCVPLDEIETDISRVLDDSTRPPEGWAWEKIDMPGNAKSKQLPKSPSSLAAPPKASNPERTPPAQN